MSATRLAGANEKDHNLTLARVPALAWARRFRLRQRLKGSLWFVPLLGGVLGGLLAAADVKLETVVSVPPAWRYSAETASGALTAIVGAMVGLFGFVVTISVLVVQMATGTLSPRFMRLWYRDRLQKLVLATFLGTVTFAFYLLRRVTSDTVPNLGITLAGIGFGGSLVLLLLYLDRFAHNLRPVGVAAMVGRWGLREAQTAAARSRTRDSTAANPMHGQTPTMVVGMRERGAVLAINVRGLVDVSTKYDCVVGLRCSVGDFVQEASPVMNVYATDRSPDAGNLVGMIALGTERSIEDDPAFALRIMVDIAIRALSPAVNDPTTGVQMINYIEALMRGLAPFLDANDHIVLTDEADNVRVVVPARTFEDYLKLAVTEIREYGGASMQICRRLTAMLEPLLDIVSASSRPPVEAELSRLDHGISARFTVEDQALARRGDRQGIGGPHNAAS